MAELAARLEQVDKRFPKSSRPALSRISAEIRPGIITGLVGPDGAGKTTLLRLLAGLMTPSSGRIAFIDAHPEQQTQRTEIAGKTREWIGYMPQKFGLYEDLSVQENLELHADLRGVLGQERKQAFEKLLQFTDLNRFTTRLAGRLSGGMKQKLGLACALLGQPRLLLLDEPSVGVDPISRRELWKMVHELIGQGLTVVWSTAYLDEAELCSEVLLLNEGQLLFSGKPGDLTARMRGRCWQIRNPTGSRRGLLARSLRRPEVMDGVIQGSAVRLVLREGQPHPDLSQLEAGPGAELVGVPPRFEDGFIDVLGGGPGADSALARRVRRTDEGPGAVVEAVELTKTFGDFAATDRVSFEVKRGEIFGLLGPNGAGKSTTFRIMCGLLTPTSGTAHVMGIDLKKSPSAARQRLGYMAQKFSLYGNLTVRQNLDFFAGVYGLGGSRRKAVVGEMVEVFKLEPFLSTAADMLPLGFKQRLALSCAVMHQPDVLFLDEPTSGVDPVTRREFWNHINGLVEKGVTVMVTTHFMDEAEYCDRIALVFRGRVIAAGTPDDLKAQASTPENDNPSMEDAFVGLVLKQERAGNARNVMERPNAQSRLEAGAPRRGMTLPPSLRRLWALSRKETFQIVRDPSSNIIAFVLPIIMLLIFGYGINLDSEGLRVGLVLEDTGPEARLFAASLYGSPYLRIWTSQNRAEMAKALTTGRVRGFVVIAQDFSQKLKRADDTALVLIVTDGAEPNTANFVENYVRSAWDGWRQQRSARKGEKVPATIAIEPRFWFNPTAESRNYLIPGSITIIMTVIGALLTSLVVAREWERGTMEALLASPMTRAEFLLSKLLPYYALGITSFFICVAVSVFGLGVPFRGSVVMLWLVGSFFLGSALGLGLLLSTTTRNQFNAAQAALNAAFLPALILSGFIYEIRSMPVVIRGVSYLIPARYFATAMQTLFQAGNVGQVLGESMVFLAAASVFFIGLTAIRTRRRLD